MNKIQNLSVGSANVFKNIKYEVVRDCAKIDIIAEENVVALTICLLSLDPSNGVRLDRSYDRHAVEGLVKKCVEKFRGKQAILLNKLLKC